MIVYLIQTRIKSSLSLKQLELRCTLRMKFILHRNFASHYETQNGLKAKIIIERYGERER